MTPYSPTPQPLIKHYVTADEIRDYVSMIVMRDEGPAQHERLRHLQEELIRLTKKRDRLNQLRMSFGQDAFGRDRPDPDQVEELYERTQIFFQGFYAAISALQTFTRHFSTWQVVQQNAVPKDIEPFIKWLADRELLSRLGIEDLLRAREMRSMFDHPDRRAFNWGSTHDLRGLTVLYLFGKTGQNGGTPVYAQDILEAPGDWQVLAPSEVSVTNAIALVVLAIAQASHWRKFKSEEKAMAWIHGKGRAEADSTESGTETTTES